jgi:hypothetical protein
MVCHSFLKAGFKKSIPEMLIAEREDGIIYKIK